MTEVYFLDVNVLMYAAGREHTYKQPSLRVLASIEAGVLSVAVDAEIFQELLYRYTAIGLADRGLELAHALLDYHPIILGLTEPDVKLSLDIFARFRDKGVGPRDALHAAVMLNNGVDRIISTDRDFDVITGITRLDPRDI